MLAMLVYNTNQSMLKPILVAKVMFEREAGDICDS